MAQITFDVIMDENLKKQFELICSDFGMTTSTAINIFAKEVVSEKRIPFEILSPEPDFTSEKALQVFDELRVQAQKNGTNSITLDEINEEIRRTRAGEVNGK